MCMLIFNLWRSYVALQPQLDFASSTEFLNLLCSWSLRTFRTTSRGQAALWRDCGAAHLCSHFSVWAKKALLWTQCHERSLLTDLLKIFSPSWTNEDGVGGGGGSAGSRDCCDRAGEPADHTGANRCSGTGNMTNSIKATTYFLAPNNELASCLKWFHISVTW